MEDFWSSRKATGEKDGMTIFLGEVFWGDRTGHFIGNGEEGGGRGIFGRSWEGGIFLKPHRFTHLIARSYGRPYPCISINSCSYTLVEALWVLVARDFFGRGFLSREINGARRTYDLAVGRLGDDQEFYGDGSHGSEPMLYSVGVFVEALGGFRRIFLGRVDF